jgi:hypothetical protein
MTVTPKCLLGSKYAENSQTTQYTATAVRAIIDKFTVANSTGSPATLAVNVVASGGSAGASNVVVATKTLAAGDTYTFPEMVGQILNAGDFISTIAGTASALVIRISGREVT